MFPWKKGNIRLVAYFARGRYLRFLSAVAATALSVAFAFLSPQVIRVTVDSVLGTRPFELPAALSARLESLGGRDFLLKNLYLCAAAFVLVSALSGLMSFLRGYLSGEAAEHTARRMRDRLYDYIQRLPYAWHVKIQTGDIIQRCTSDVEMVKSFLGNQLPEMARIVFLVVISVTLMFSMDAELTWIALSLIPLIFLFSLIYYAKVSVRFKLVDEAEGAMQSAVQENLTGVRVVRAFGRERFETDRFEEKNGTYVSLALRLYSLMSFYWSFGDMMTGLQMLLVMSAGVLRCVNGGMTLGTYLTFQAYSAMLTWPVRALGRIISDLGKTRISLNRLRDILGAEPETDGEGCTSPEIYGDVRFENVTFSYSGQPVLENVSFEVKPGETLAILGGTGSGKSTIAHLLCRLYDLPEGCGRITVDGVDIREISRRHLRRNVGLVLQEPFLFSKTVRENICAAAPRSTLEEVRRFAAVASVDESILGFAKGYDTVVGERGVTLSGGQKQRVAIARMLMQRAPIMIFDDSLSAVDAETDARIRHALSALSERRGAATILISHRVSTLMNADRILVLRDGRVEETGSHAQLLAKNGTYRRVFEMQGSFGPDFSGENGEKL